MIKENCPHLAQNVTQSLQGRVIYKDQCTKCFIDPLDTEGIFLCLYCFNGGCKSGFNHSLEHFNITQHSIALNIKMKEKKQVQQQGEITKLAIGKEGGISGEQTQYIPEYSVYCFECQATIDSKSIDNVLKSVENSNSSFSQGEIAQWEDEIFPCEHTLTLQQQEKILSAEQLSHCTDCELSKNLWLCLTCGNIGCGRKQYDGSGGNNHGINHFNTTKHPLAVKMGTITADGSASIYCYQCDSDVKDDQIANHLINFGLDIKRQTKTEKTMTELNLAANLSLTLSSIIEEGKQLKPIFGAFNTGLSNIGNSCYLNSVLQILFQFPEFQKKYFEDGQNHLNECKKFTPSCFYCQFSKLGFGLCSGIYSVQKEHIVSKEDEAAGKILEENQKFYQDGIKIYDVKQLLAAGNKEFQSSKMQDALEYLEHLLSLLEKQEKIYKIQESAPLFQFKQVSKLKCYQCQGVKIQEQKNLEIKFPVRQPTQEELEQAAKEKLAKKEKQQRENNSKSSEEQVANTVIDLDFEGPQYITSFEECANMYLQGTEVELDCPNCGKNKLFHKVELFKTMPKYLILAMNRNIVQNWVPKKLNAMIQMPQEYDFNQFIYQELQKGEHFLSEKKNEIQVDKQALQAIIEMGFTENRATRALLACNQNQEAATNWIFERMEDETLDLPIQNQAENQKGDSKIIQFSQESLETIQTMGFSITAAKYALKKCDSNLERAMDFLFSHEDVEQEALIDEQDQKQIQNMEQEINKEFVQEDEQIKQTKYNLRGVVVHLGTSALSGHYVAYFKRQNQWILFNDSKVAATDDPVLGKGYFYIFERK